MKSRGAYPEFSREDVVLALFELNEPLGRKRLADYLGVGEGSVRTLLSKMDHLVDSSSKGHFLNKEGKKVIKEIKEYLAGPKKLESKISAGDYPKFGLKLKKTNLENGTEVRDEIIRGGAKGALVLNVNNTNILFPEDETRLNEVYPELSNELSSKFDLKKEGVLLISWGNEDQGKSCLRASIILHDGLANKIDKILK